eukprot:EG_transcript_38690
MTAPAYLQNCSPADGFIPSSVSCLILNLSADCCQWRTSATINSMCVSAIAQRSLQSEGNGWTSCVSVTDNITNFKGHILERCLQGNDLLSECVGFAFAVSDVCTVLFCL